MTLSLWILKDYLDDFEPEIFCINHKTEITEIRLYHPSLPLERQILYLGTSDQFFGDGRQNIICKHMEDFLMLHTENIFAVSNRILEAFSYYARWHEQCSQKLSQSCTLSDLLDLAESIFDRPLLIVDSSQFMIANSSRIPAYSDSEEWQSIIQAKSIPADKLKLFNQFYKETFLRHHAFSLPADYFPTSSCCQHIFVNDERCATLILIEGDEKLTKGQVQLLELFTPFITEWLHSNMTTDTSYHFTSFFARSLDGAPDSGEALQRRLALFGWDAKSPKQIFVATAISDYFHFDAHLSRILSDESGGVYSIPYQKHLVVLCNYDLVDRNSFHQRFQDLMKTNSYYGASGFVFYDLEDIASSFKQTLEALQQGTPEIGFLYSCQSIAMKFITNIVEQHMNTSLLHPTLDAIREYDKAHKTQFFQTLFVFLKNERNHQLTAKELYIHRNTLFLRLQKINELWELNLEDAEERFYMLYSFYHMCDNYPPV
ncbi:MAG: helix-turn-helix domain-containing protein [Eubacterium sp.]|nr:helix-turn-helix domain-containing protein [Eubacterium sp.]